MDKRLQILESLYESNEPPAEITSDDPSADAELRALKDVKGLLDRKPPLRPDESVIDSITAIASEEWRNGLAQKPAQSRPHPQMVAVPRKPVRHARIYALRMIAAASVLFAVVAVGLWQFDFGADTASDVVAQEESKDQQELRSVPAFAERSEAENDLDDQVGSGFASDMVGTLAAKPVGVRQDSIPGWSDPDELVLVRKRVQAMQQNSRSLDWDDSMIPLEMMPVGGSSRGLQQTSASRPIQ